MDKCFVKNCGNLIYSNGLYLCDVHAGITGEPLLEAESAYYQSLLIETEDALRAKSEECAELKKVVEWQKLTIKNREEKLDALKKENDMKENEALSPKVTG